MKTYYHLSEIPLTPIDLVNRRALATGSMRYAQLSSNADYNGHHIEITFKPYAIGGARWTSEYYWGDWVRLGRGSLANAIEGAKREYDRGAHGTTVQLEISDTPTEVGESSQDYEFGVRTKPRTYRGSIVEAPESVAEQIALAKEHGFLEGKTPADRRSLPWWTEKHEIIMDAIKREWFNDRIKGQIIAKAIAHEGSLNEWMAMFTRDTSWGAHDSSNPWRL